MGAPAADDGRRTALPTRQLATAVPPLEASDKARFSILLCVWAMDCLSVQVARLLQYWLLYLGMVLGSRSNMEGRAREADITHSGGYLFYKGARYLPHNMDIPNKLNDIYIPR